MDAYEAAFKTTPVLLRYPAGEKDDQKAKNADRKFGYHDDSFAWATLHTGKKGDDWFYMTALKAAGPDAEAKWKTHPDRRGDPPGGVGRGVRRQAGKKADPELPRVRGGDARHLADGQRHVRRRSRQADRIKRAEEEVRRMGYEFHAPAVTIGDVDGRQAGA